MNTQNTARDLNLETKIKKAKRTKNIKIKNVEAEVDPIIREIEVRKKKKTDDKEEPVAP